MFHTIFRNIAHYRRKNKVVSSTKYKVGKSSIKMNRFHRNFHHTFYANKSTTFAKIYKNKLTIVIITDFSLVVWPHRCHLLSYFHGNEYANQYWWRHTIWALVLLRRLRSGHVLNTTVDRTSHNILEPIFSFRARFARGLFAKIGLTFVTTSG